MSEKMVPQISVGDTVTLHFSSTDAETGELLEYTYEEEPKAYTIGKGEINPRFEEALIGCRADDEITVDLTAKEAYGTYNKELVLTIKRKRLPKNAVPEEGTIIPLKLPRGGEAHVKILSVSKSTVVVDANHPFAGRDIQYKIWVCSVTPSASNIHD
ncbi:FKBP-type peptidyl-prolyl cis-trans isomerase [Methanogenium organophilum]|uniref:Peptidyl-prolyl cis-trans isomerase n=1 Tax=Methanogenium organophilum TaxID=2199 RepID=A0A9X9T7U4_METOG|nr:FKBP-type peptidyl-prolyl cis-trans isomerase [Methanogenium organophilum]WAI01060.1 FKBP-type peptidyl-prolyl cis-trans isomerase [Methanogenium organophilum]